MFLVSMGKTALKLVPVAAQMYVIDTSGSVQPVWMESTDSRVTEHVQVNVRTGDVRSYMADVKVVWMVSMEITAPTSAQKTVYRPSVSRRTDTV